MDKIMLNKKQQKLECVKEKLKKDFIGLDSEIDQIVDSINIWYSFPDLLDRPTIINIWGLTGTGKTDLIRKLIDYLDFEDKFCEIQMDDANWSSLEQEVLNKGFKEDSQGVLLLDEFQRFRTIDGNGDELKNKTLNDVWGLLSDGQFINKNRNNFNQIIYSLEFRIEESYTNEKEEEFKLDRWEVNRYKELFKLSQPTQDLLKMSPGDLVSLLKNKLDTSGKELFKNSEFKKLLVFICGNLDEAYKLNSYTSNVDIDANTLHEYSNNLNIITIKKALSERFKPEQIARLGNNHVIYSSLSENSFLELIAKQMTRYKNLIKENYQINLNYSDDLKFKLYQNCVFPTQGTRPVFSTINNFFSFLIPEVVSHYYNDNTSDTVYVSVRNSNIKMTFTCGNSFSRPYIFNIDKLKDNKTEDSLALYAVHEAAHAIVYAALFNTPPTVLKIRLSQHGAFIQSHDILFSKGSILKMIAVYYAGQVGESFIFGDSNLSEGVESDIYEATMLGGYYIRKYGFDGFNCRVDSNSSLFNTAVDETNETLESITDEQKKRAGELLSKHKDAFLVLIKEALKKETLSTKDMYEVLKSYMPNLECFNLFDKIETNYASILSNYLGDGERL